MGLGENIRKRRLALKMSQQSLADAMGYKTRSSITRIEKEETGVDQKKLKRLARILKTNEDYLLNGEEHKQPRAQGNVVKVNMFQETEIAKRDGRRKTVAVILAGGKLRVNAQNVPYQFVSVKGKPIVLYTMEAFQHHPQVDEIYVVCPKEWEDLVSSYAQKHEVTKLKDIIPAGETGIESVRHAVEWLSLNLTALDLVIIQEATRPFVEPETVSNAIRCCTQFGSAVVYEQLDGVTPFLIGENNTGIRHLPASRLINVQSPEVYAFGVLRQAFFEALKVGHSMEETVCAVFLHNMGRDLRFCEGNRNNFRLVYEDDIKMFEFMLE